MAPSRELNRAIRESIRRIREAALYDRARLGTGARIDGPAIITELFSAATGLLGRRNSSIGLPRPTTTWMIPPRRRSIDPIPTEASNQLSIWRGTEISNPFRSSGESANFRFLSGERICVPQRPKHGQWRIRHSLTHPVRFPL